MNQRGIYIPFVLALAWLLTSCGNSFRNDEIDADLRKKLRALNKQLIVAIAENSPAKLKALAAPVFLKSLKGNALAVWIKDAQPIFRPEAYTPKDDYYERRRSKGASVLVQSGDGSGAHDYIIRYRSLTRKSYVSVGTIGDTAVTYGLLTIWNSYDGDWKLTTLRLGLMKIEGLDAVDWYYRAQGEHTYDAVADALLAASVCRQLLHPFDSGFSYVKEKMMDAAANGIAIDAERTFEFPRTVPAVATKPSVFSLSAITYEGHHCPVISYVTQLPLTDSIAVRREADSINAHIGEVLVNIDHYNHTLLYSAYPHMPVNKADDVLHRNMVLKSAATWFYGANSK